MDIGLTMATQRVFIPWTDWTPDKASFLNDGLVEAANVCPAGDTYINHCLLEYRTDSALAAKPLGFHTHATGTGWRGYFGTATKLYDISGTDTSAWTVTDKTRAAGGDYTATAWHGTSFGENVIMTDFADDVQYLPTPASANFTGLISSGAAAPTDGMRPKAKFVFPIKNNLFLGYLNLPGVFDGLASGDNPTAVAWSQTDNIRQFGSFNATPSLIGSGYQPLNYDLGYITGAIGGQYGLVAMQRGWVRIDGPPYNFRPISLGVGCQYPYSICRLDDDTYFWGPSGPMVLRGGEGPAIPLGRNRVQRTVVGGIGSFQIGGVLGGAVASRAAATNVSFEVSTAADTASRTVWFSYHTGFGSVPPIFNLTSTLIYDVDSDRFSVIAHISRADSGIGEFRLLRSTTENHKLDGYPGRDIVGMRATWVDSVATHKPAIPYYAAGLLDFTSYLTTGLKQLSPDATTRVRRVRPVLSLAETHPFTFSVKVHSRNKTTHPNSVTGVSGPFTNLDTHGWVVCPTTSHADFHQVALQVTTSILVGEMEGIEVEYETGGAYSA